MEIDKSQNSQLVYGKTRLISVMQETRRFHWMVKKYLSRVKPNCPVTCWPSDWWVESKWGKSAARLASGLVMLAVHASSLYFLCMLFGSVCTSVHINWVPCDHSWHVLSCECKRQTPDMESSCENAEQAVMHNQQGWCCMAKFSLKTVKQKRMDMPSSFVTCHAVDYWSECTKAVIV